MVNAEQTKENAMTDIPHEDLEKLKIKIKELIAESGANPESFEGDLIGQIIFTSLKMARGEHDIGQLKLMTRALKEMRYAYRIFKQYPTERRISIFGSARTPEHHPDYEAAKKFSAEMASQGWVTITGASDGIMKAGLEGSHLESSFGLCIKLPFESTVNSIIAGDPKLITFRYFFTRKLMFLSHSHAVAAFPGGVGTQDELFEVLTLMQTGKADIIPVVLVEGEKGSYWESWNNYIKSNLLQNGWISEDDLNFYYIAPTIEKAVEHIQTFYKRYHSSRYVNDLLVIRLKEPISDKHLDRINSEYSTLFEDGKAFMTEAFLEETDHLELPRIAFKHNRRRFGTLRALINCLNE